MPLWIRRLILPCHFQLPQWIIAGVIFENVLYINRLCTQEVRLPYLKSKREFIVHHLIKFLCPVEQILVKNTCLLFLIFYFLRFWNILLWEYQNKLSCRNREQKYATMLASLCKLVQVANKGIWVWFSFSDRHLFYLILSLQDVFYFITVKRRNSL